MLNQYNFANQLKELRQEKSISQNQIANQLNKRLFFKAINKTNYFSLFQVG